MTDIVLPQVVCESRNPQVKFSVSEILLGGTYRGSVGRNSGLFGEKVAKGNGRDR